jgi:two-component sensor histidine kinase
MTLASEWCVDPFVVGLLVNELATNAVQHARTPFAVSLDYETHRLRIEVTDDSPEMRGGLGGGIGLKIVDELTKWGVDHHMQGGKTIWADLSI